MSDPIPAAFYDEDYFLGRQKKSNYSEASWDWRKMAPHYMALATDLLKYRPTRVLDCGCALGMLVRAFRSLNVEAWGVDISAYALAQADPVVKPYLKQCNLGVEPLPFDDPFDLVVCLDVLEHLDITHQLGVAFNELTGICSKTFVAHHPCAIRYKEPTDQRSTSTDKSHRTILPAHSWIRYFHDRGFRLIECFESGNAWDYYFHLERMT